MLSAEIFVGSFIGVPVVFGVALVLVGLGKLEAFQAVRTFLFPGFLLVLATIASNYKETVLNATPLAVMAFLISLGVLLTFTVGEWRKRRDGKSELLANTIDALQREPKKLVLQARPDFQPTERRISGKTLYKNRELLLFVGDVGQDQVKRFTHRCEGFIQDDTEAVTVQIHSAGGVVRDGWSMHEQLRVLASAADVMVAVVGDCQSAATYLLMAVPIERRFATPNSTFMLHRCALLGQSGKFVRPELSRKERLSLRATDTRYVDFVVTSTGVERAGMEALMRTETEVVLTAQQALELGIIGGIIEV